MIEMKFLLIGIMTKEKKRLLKSMTLKEMMEMKEFIQKLYCKNTQELLALLAVVVILLVLLVQDHLVLHVVDLLIPVQVLQVDLEDMDLAQEIADQEIAMDLAQEIAMDLAQEIAMDLAREIAMDLAREITAAEMIMAQDAPQKDMVLMLMELHLELVTELVQDLLTDLVQDLVWELVKPLDTEHHQDSITLTPTKELWEPETTMEWDIMTELPAEIQRTLAMNKCATY